jgi:hypothetical protein
MQADRARRQAVQLARRGELLELIGWRGREKRRDCTATRRLWRSAPPSRPHLAVEQQQQPKLQSFLFAHVFCARTATLPHFSIDVRKHLYHT